MTSGTRRSEKAFHLRGRSDVFSSWWTMKTPGHIDHTRTAFRPCESCGDVSAPSVHRKPFRRNHTGKDARRCAFSYVAPYPRSANRPDRKGRSGTVETECYEQFCGFLNPPVW